MAKKQQRKAFEIYMGTEKVGSVRVEWSLPVPWQMEVRTKNRVYLVYRIKEDLWLVKERSLHTEKRIEAYPSWMDPYERKLKVVYIDRNTIFVEAVGLDEMLYLTNTKRVDMILQNAEDLKIYK
jgi:hypothetical protein